MATLEKKHAVKILADILSEIYEDNKYSFPVKFNDFGHGVAKKLYKRFSHIEGNPIVFEKTQGLDELPLKMSSSFVLVGDKENG